MNYLVVLVYLVTSLFLAELWKDTVVTPQGAGCLGIEDLKLPLSDGCLPKLCEKHWA